MANFRPALPLCDRWEMYADVVHVDETGIKQDGEQAWIWTFTIRSIHSDVIRLRPALTERQCRGLKPLR